MYCHIAASEATTLVESADMIRSLSLTNFKGFQRLRNLEIKPVTILCGTNSSGKSSILQSILLLKQTLESQMPNQVLLLNGRLVHLGPFEEVIFDREIDRRLGFDFQFTISPRHRASSGLGNRIPLDFLLQQLTGLENQDAVDVRFCVNLKTSKQGAADAQLNPLQVESLEFSFSREAKK